MTKEVAQAIYNEVSAWGRKLCPCEKPCDSFGVCEGCCELALILASSSKSLRAVYKSEHGVDLILENSPK